MIRLGILGILVVGAGGTYLWRSGAWIHLWGSRSPFAGEEHWLVHEVAADVAEMGAYAAAKRGGVDVSVSMARANPGVFGGAVVRASTAGTALTHAIPSADPFDPRSFEPFAAEWLRTLGLRARPGKTDARVLRSLADLRAETLDDVSRSVSTRLAEGMLDPTNHEEAALVVGAFGLREAGGLFNDLRGILCRLTAHLAMARALGSGTLGTTGMLADAVRLTLLARTADALALIDELSRRPDRPIYADPLMRALVLRNTDDWRGVAERDDLTLVEQAACFRAMNSTLTSVGALSWLERQSVPRVSDWSRIALDQRASVEVGNRLFPVAVEQELSELAAVYRRETGREFPKAAPAAVLNEAPERCIGRSGWPRVLSLGAWAASAQRHLCEHVFRSDYHTRRALGMPKEADEERRRIDGLLGRATLFPIAVLWRIRESELDEKAAPEASLFVLLNHPELVNPVNWDGVRDAAVRARMAYPDPTRWFSRALLRDSTFDTWMRRYVFAPTRDEWTAVHTLAPHNYWVTQMWLRATGRLNRPLDELRQAFGSRSDYDLRVLRLLEENAPAGSAEALAVFIQRCDLDAEYCINLGYELVARGDDDGAERAFRRAYDHADDRVFVAYQMRWLVDRYYARGEVGRALEVATHGAAVYSGTGLAIYGSLLERMGRFQEAEEQFAAIAERYENSADLLGFCYRMARERGRANYEERLQELVAKELSGGLVAVRIADMVEPPKRGAVLKKVDRLGREAGLSIGDVIVGLDGWRVGSKRDCRAIVELGTSRSLALIVWQGGRYREATIKNVIDRHRVLVVDDYPPRPE